MAPDASKHARRRRGTRHAPLRGCRPVISGCLNLREGDGLGQPLAGTLPEVALGGLLVQQ